MEPGVFQSIIELANDGILVFDETYRIEYANPMASKITGFSKAQLLTRDALSLFGETNHAMMKDLFSLFPQDDWKTWREIQLRTALGETVEIEVCFVLMETPRRGRKACAYLMDIADSKRMGQEGRKVTREFRKMAEMGDDGIILLDQEFRILFANQTASEIIGIPKEDLKKRDFFTVIGKQDKEFLEGTIIRGEGIGQKLCTEMTIFTPQGETKDGEVCISCAKSGAEEIKTYVYIRDITERKKIQRALQESERKLRTLFERVRHGLFLSSKDGKFLDCNQALFEMLGYSSKKEFLGIDIMKDLYLHPEDREIIQEKIERDGYVKDLEVEFKKKDGETITVLLTGHPIKNGQGQTVGYEGINLDISERKRIENDLRKANDFLMNLIESSVDGIIVTDMKGNITIFNKGAEHLTGHKAEEVIGRMHITQIYPPGVAKEVMKKLRSLEWGGVGRLLPLQFNVVNRAGEEIPIQLSASLIHDELGREMASVGIFTDLRPRITIEKKLEETYLQLVSSEKMASLGKLAAGIAHEINNPLGGILIFSSLIMEELPDEDPKRQDLARIVQEASRCKDIVKSLLEFARQTGPKMEPTDINRAITDDLFFLENQALFHNIHIIKKLDPSLPFAHGNAGQLKQVFMNIIVNAAEAIHGSGTLTITTALAPGRKSVSVEFTDTGEGIPEENFTRIFDPFFTTKDIGKGTGLGLATSYGIIESHGGKIGVKSKVGQGTTFTIELPIHAGTQTFLENRSANQQRVKNESKHADESEEESLST